MPQKTCVPNSMFYKVVLADCSGLSLRAHLYILICAQWECTRLYKPVNKTSPSTDKGRGLFLKRA